MFIADGDNHRIRKVGANGMITTVAGTGTRGYSGDNGAATNAALCFPQGVAADGSGNLFIADSLNNRIRKVSTNGIITTVAGGGPNFPGDGGAANNASLHGPTGVAVDTSGCLFIADFYNNRIRKVDTNGLISTVAGNGSATYSGDGGAATNASVYWPAGVAVDASGNLFIADEINNRIRKVSVSGIITTAAGNGTNGYSGDSSAATNAALSYPQGVAVDAFGNLFIGDTFNNRIRQVGTNGIISTMAGTGTRGYSGDNGAAASANLDLPSGVTVDAFGNLFFADTVNNRIRKVTNTQGPVLALNNVTAANAGKYQAVITGAYGSVTSAVATLTVNGPAAPTFQRLALAGSTLTLTWSATVGSGYQLKYKTDLAGTNWIDLGDPITAAGGTATACDSMINSQRFYRVELLR